MPRGRAWTQAEVSSLLALVRGSGEAALLMASTSRPNEALWREISRGLAASGYGRTVAQCRSKWKALKQAFHSERETRRRAGCHSPRLPPHYRAMKSIWKAAGRPIFGERRMPDLVKLPPRKGRSALTNHSPPSPEPPEHNVGGDTPGTLQSVKDEPASRCHTSLKQERDEQKAGFPGETSSAVGRGNRVLPVGTSALNSPGVAAISEQPAAGQEASDTSLHSGFSLPHPNSLSRGSQSRGEVLLLLTPISPQVLAWQACSRASSSCWCRSCKHPSSSRHCWRAWPVTPSPTSTFSHTAWCRWVRPCTSSCSGHRPTSAPSATTTPTCHFLRVTPGCPAPLVFPTSPWITKRCPPPLVATPCECHQLQEQPLHYTAMAQIFIAEAPDILKVYRRETF
ncbi:uncharacterized protein [Heliangelus exortis]|uniref:uncharacterized protein isoform X1 n=1 Tax=Heliangelus exortis TaxID=472823 RepID=UPI003A932E80